jgi:hypothetical protein
MKKIFLASILCLLYLTFIANADDEMINGIYSNMSYNQEAGDLIGVEIFIFPSKTGHFAFVQIAEGGFPYAALIPVKLDGDKIEFLLPNDGVYAGGKFIGIVKNGYIDGKFEGTMHSEKLKLKKGKSYWQ